MKYIKFVGLWFLLILHLSISDEFNTRKKRSPCDDTSEESNCPLKYKRKKAPDTDYSEGTTTTEISTTGKPFEPSRNSSNRFQYNHNKLKNINKIDINPNITMTNTIRNTNNISVPINITSSNVNTIRVSSNTRSQTNSIGSTGCSKDKPTDCSEKTKRIILIPIPHFNSQKPEMVTFAPTQKELPQRFVVPNSPSVTLPVDSLYKPTYQFNPYQNIVPFHLATKFDLPLQPNPILVPQNQIPQTRQTIQLPQYFWYPHSSIQNQNMPIASNQVLQSSRMAYSTSCGMRNFNEPYYPLTYQSTINNPNVRTYPQSGNQFLQYSGI